MMTEYPDLDRMLSRYFDGSISAKELAELESRVLADEEFADRVSRSCLLHRQIAELLTETRLHELMDNFIKGSRTLPQDAVLQFTSADSRNKNSSRSDPASAGRRYLARKMAVRSLIAWGSVAVSVLALAAWALA